MLVIRRLVINLLRSQLSFEIGLSPGYSINQTRRNKYIVSAAPGFISQSCVGLGGLIWNSPGFPNRRHLSRTGLRGEVTVQIRGAIGARRRTFSGSVLLSVPLNRGFGLEFRLLAAAHQQPDRPSNPSYQATKNLATNGPQISPGELPGNTTGGGAGEYRHQ